MENNIFTQYETAKQKLESHEKKWYYQPEPEIETRAPFHMFALAGIAFLLATTLGAVAAAPYIALGVLLSPLAFKVGNLVLKGVLKLVNHKKHKVLLEEKKTLERKALLTPKPEKELILKKNEIVKAPEVVDGKIQNPTPIIDLSTDIEK